ncbi:MAG: Na+/H+ antiporter NhaC family protein [Campylobacterota bacterium]|nr:Na+/H+ antiporter NhaC family protein [Campylobacterota bacterium]
MALLTRHVLLSLFIGIVSAQFIIADFSIVDTLNLIYELFITLLTKAWILKTLIFALLVGSVMSLLKASGGIEGFINMLTHRYALVKSKRSALILTYIVGVVIFIESSITALIAGTLGRPLSDKYGVSRAKLAYVCDSTSAPVCSLIMINGWGALVLGLIATQISSEVIAGDSVSWLIDSLLYNFYAMSALVVTFVVIWFDFKVGKNSVPITNQSTDDIIHKDASLMLLPIIVMIATVFVSLYMTGDGNMLKGSGSTAIFYSQIVTLIFMFVMYLGKKVMSVKVWVKEAYVGLKSMREIVMILLFAFAIGASTQQLHTGTFLAEFTQDILSPTYLAAVIFLLSGIMAFATGTSWGTFSIMIPIAVPMAVGMDANVALCIGAAISGGVFGDHCSPISDTTIISSLAAECNHIEHVKTQLPYALFSGTVALLLFIAFS